MSDRMGVLGSSSWKISVIQPKGRHGPGDLPRNGFSESFRLLRPSQNSRISEMEGVLNIRRHPVQTSKHLVGF